MATQQATPPREKAAAVPRSAPLPCALPLCSAAAELSTARQATQWAEERCVEALWTLLKEGLALVDDQGPQSQRLYWFPCISASQGRRAEASLLEETPSGVG